MLYYNKRREKEGIDKTNGQDCHGKKNSKSQECYYCLSYIFVFKIFKYNFNLCDDCYRCKQRENVWKSAYFWIIKVKSSTFRIASNYEGSEIINLLQKSQLDDKCGVLRKKREKFEENKKIEINKPLKMIKEWIFIWSWTAISRIDMSVLSSRL